MQNILIIHQWIDPISTRIDELDTLIQASTIANHLKKFSYNVVLHAIDSITVLEKILQQYPDFIVFNLVESYKNKDHFAYIVPAILEANNIPFTGNSSWQIQLSNQKKWLNSLLDNLGIPIPKQLSIHNACTDTRYIIKSATEHASFGLSEQNVVMGFENIQKRHQELQQEFGGDWLIEEYIHGREFNISILENTDGSIQILPMAELQFVNYDLEQVTIVDYDAKWNEHSFSYNHTKRVFIDPNASTEDAHLWTELQKICTKLWNCLKLKGYVRIDFRVDQDNNPFVIDVNTNPCLSEDAGFIAACKEVGLSFIEVVQQIIETGWNQQYSLFSNKEDHIWTSKSPIN